MSTADESGLGRRIKHLQLEVGEGPCIDAIWQRPVFESADLRDHVLEWPKFVPGAIEAGIESMLAFRLFAVEETLGALDLSSGQRGGFDKSAREHAVSCRDRPDALGIWF